MNRLRVKDVTGKYWFGRKCSFGVWGDPGIGKLLNIDDYMYVVIYTI